MQNYNVIIVIEKAPLVSADGSKY